MSDPFELSDQPFPAARADGPAAARSFPASGSTTAPAKIPALQPPAYLDALNPTQRESVEATDGPVLVLAGAGTGKTRVLTTRLAHILAQGKARPWQILAVTFTNKAAREMRERVSALAGVPVEGWWLGTFHAIGARMLRAHAEAAGLKPGFTILDTDDQLRLVKQLLELRNIDPKRSPPRVALAIIQRWKDRGLTPDRVSQAEGAEAMDGLALPLYHDYQSRLATVNAADFGDLLLHNLTLFRTAPDVLERYQQQFRYILVDEYQDTNVAQYLWLRALARGHHNICCVGDDDQSIYSWRGAEVGNILRFEHDFPGARVIRLEHNYRSSPHILAAASGLIAHNRSRLGKTLRTDRGEGEKVVVRGVWDGDDEARMVCETAERLVQRGQRLSEMAVLVRAGFQTRAFEERMITVGMPYRVVGGLRFYERQEVRDAIAYLRVVFQPADDLAFERIVNLPKRGLGVASLRAVHALARAERLPLTVAAERLAETDELKPAARRALSRLLADIARWRDDVPRVPGPELTRRILDESGYTAMWQQDRSPEAPGRLENLKELVSAIEDFDSIPGFLEHVSLVMENDENGTADKVTLMTLHAAKGLEFDTVFLPGWEEGLFPHQRALDQGGSAALEEERRLAYVGLTRARQRAFISYAANRHVYGYWQNAIPSRFIGELPEDAVEVAAVTGLAGGGGRLRDGSVERLTEPLAGDAVDSGGRSRRTVPVIEGVPYRSTPRPTPTGPFRPGQRVRHGTFGEGRVVSASGDVLEIAFDGAGTKRIVRSFVEAVA
ncbi:MAG: DNA helicase II [Rhodospirillales bacterium]|nr:MAG: DNA helicase II [Rhodospirillales bacterium]